MVADLILHEIECVVLCLKDKKMVCVGRRGVLMLMFRLGCVSLGLFIHGI